KLQNLSGLDNLETVKGYLYVNENEQLANLNGLDSLQYLYEGHLGINGNPALLNIDALSNLKGIKQLKTSWGSYASQVSISGNKLLANLNGLHQI
ncbi:MAG: hypothetical protein L6Q97_06570, partial [Thermoanaerobaculia bacterium]|nr:hypothetical protein [Thermoanaerobaculia bacterium]